jgi:hypothetical protein
MNNTQPERQSTLRTYKCPMLTVIGDLAHLTRTLRVTGRDDGGNNGTVHRTAH